MHAAQFGWRKSRSTTFGTASVVLVVGLTALLWTPALSIAQNVAEDPRTHEEGDFSLEVIDAKAFGPSPLGFITGDPTSVVDPSWVRSGALADGASVLVIRLDPIHWRGPVKFILTATIATHTQTPDYVGSLSNTFPFLPAPDTGAGLGVTTVTSGASTAKFVFYRPPNNFLYSIGTTAELLTVTASTPGGLTASTQILLIRPPLLFNHGIFSGPATWKPLTDAIVDHGSSAEADTVDWSDINSSGFDDITLRLISKVNRTLAAEVARGAAATRLDVVGHSAGGVMVKWWASDLGNYIRRRDPAGVWPILDWAGNSHRYHTPENYGIGSIRRFISIGSPFKGSAWGDAISGVPYERLLLIQSSPGARGRIMGDLALISDLGESTVASNILNLVAIGMPKISWYPLVGIGWPNKHARDIITSDELLAFLVDEAVLHVSLFQIGSLEELAKDLGFTAKNSDFVVLASSAVDLLGGTTPPAGFSQDTLLNTTHTGETSDPLAALAVMESLDLWVDPSTTDPAYSPGYTYFNANLSPR